MKYAEFFFLFGWYFFTATLPIEKSLNFATKYVFVYSSLKLVSIKRIEESSEIDRDRNEM